MSGTWEVRARQISWRLPSRYGRLGRPAPMSTTAGPMTLPSVLFALLAGPCFLLLAAFVGLNQWLFVGVSASLRRRASRSRWWRQPVERTSEPKSSAHREIHFMRPSVRKPCKQGKTAPVAQWIEQRFPKPRAQVRFWPGASCPRSGHGGSGRVPEGRQSRFVAGFCRWFDPKFLGAMRGCRVQGFSGLCDTVLSHERSVL